MAIPPPSGAEPHPPLRFPREHPSPEILHQACGVFSSGGVLLVPTDTVYGIGCRADLPGAVDRLYAIKERSLANAIPVLLAEPAWLDRFAETSRTARELAERYWPGALTLVVRARGNLAANLSTTGTLGFRCPDHPALCGLMRVAQCPMAATSANRSGEKESGSLEGVNPEIRRQCSLVLDGGSLGGGIPSTVVDCTGDTLRVLRHGAIEIPEA